MGSISCSASVYAYDEYPRLAAISAAMCGAVLALSSGACFSPSFEACAVTCGPSEACPDGQFCLTDGRCHAGRDEELCSLDRQDGAPNDGAVDPDGGTVDGGNDAGEMEVDAGPPVRPTEIGDLVVSEIHKDPDAVADEQGEWFEVFNPTDSTFDLRQLVVRDLGGEAFTVDQSLIVAPRGRLVFARVADPAVNGGVTADFAYGAEFALGNNNTDEILIENRQAGVEIDRVAFENFTFPNVQGASISLDPEDHDAVSNDLGMNWCEGQTKYGDGDRGTPGRPNPQCL